MRVGGKVSHWSHKPTKADSISALRNQIVKPKPTKLNKVGFFVSIENVTS